MIGLKNINKWKYIVSLAIILGFLVSFFQIKAEDELMKWKKLDTMDTNFSVIQNKAGSEDILLDLDVEDAGTYHLYYYLEDGRQTEIRFTQSYDQINIEYYVLEDLGATNVTQDLTSLSYLEMDYGLTIPDWKYDANKLVGVSGGLEYIIEKSASSKYPGVAFDVDNKRVIIKWDFQKDKVYILVDNYEAGNVMPIIYVTPDNSTETIKVLKQLEDFTVTPMHLKPNLAGTDDEELAPVVLPNTQGDVPGNRPGLEVVFKQPKELDITDWDYKYISSDFDDITAIFEFENIGTDAYLDFMINLKNDADQDIMSLPAEDAIANAGVEYTYDPATHTYIIKIVKDKSDLINQGTIIEWSELEMSSIYNIAVGFQVDMNVNTFDEYEFTNYQPENKFAYTYMAYELKRASVEEAYLEIEPFSIGNQDEIEYIILYSKVIKPNLDIDEDLWLRNYHSASSDGDKIFIPVPFRSQSSQDAYQVIVKFAGTQINAQVLNYEAINDLNVPPTTPGIKLIDNLFVVPPMDPDSENPEKVQLDMIWDAPTNKNIKELDIIFENLNGINDDFLYYELSVNDVPTDNVTNPFQVVKVFEVYKDAGEYKLRLHEDTVGTGEGSELVNYDFGYNAIDERLRMDKISLYDENLYGGTEGWTPKLTTVIDEVANTYTVSSTGNKYDFEFPGVNYLRIKAITIKDGEIATSQSSIPSSLSLSMIRYDIPIVDTLSYEPLYGIEADGTTGVKLKWHTIESSNYENKVLEPIGKKIESVVYSVYIAENASKVLPLDETDDNYTSMLMNTSQLMQLDEMEIATLRNGDVVYFELSTDTVMNTNLDVNVQGLDVNKNYAIRIVTKLNIQDTPDVGNPIVIRRSDPSGVLGVTVPQVPEEPGDEEVYPLAPEFFRAEFADDRLILAGLTWYMPGEMSFADDLHGFEIFAIEDKSMPDDLSSKKVSIMDLLEAPSLVSDVVEGWRLFVHNGTTYFKKYNRTTNVWEDKDLSLVDIEDNQFYIIDDSNAPNKVNYYYVRTIKLEDETVKSASTWTADTLTTAPVKGPINLKIDYESGFSYIPKEELIIYFDAPIPNIADIGVDYGMEIHVKGEDDIDYFTEKYPAILLGERSGGTVGYKRLFYRITDLEPGKTYSIKIRIEDRTKPKEVLPDGSLSYPKSPYSDRVLSRTEFDQEAYDKEQKYKEYIDYYLEKAATLKEKTYFQIKNTVMETAIKYRENYMEGSIKRVTNGELKLYTDNKAINTFYIPSSTIESLNDEHVTVVINSKGQLIGLRPESIGIGITQEIDNVIRNIKQYYSIDKDYYLRIQLYTDTYNGRIDNKPPSSKLVQVTFGIVGSKELEEKIDEKMVNQLSAVIEANKATLVRRLEEELVQGINEEELLGITQEVIDKVEIEYMAQAAILFNGNIRPEVDMVHTLNKPMYVELKANTDFSSNQVYTKKNNLWQQVPSIYLNDKYYVDTKTFEPFILVPSLVIDGSLSELYTWQGSEIINMYNLTDVFSAYELNNPNTVIYKYQWIAALSRLIGARQGLDTVDYLNDRGIDTLSTSNYLPMEYDYSLNLFINTYAYRHNIDLGRVRITNYNIIQDMNLVRTDYRQSLLQGANLGIVPTNNGFIDPKHKTTLDDAIRLLITLQNGLN